MAYDAQTLIDRTPALGYGKLSFRSLRECITGTSASHSSGTSPVIADGSGGFWILVVDSLGNIGALPVAGPAGTPPVLSDGVGGFWEIDVTPGGLRFATPVAGPATGTITLNDGSGNNFLVQVDGGGNIYSLPV